MLYTKSRLLNLDSNIRNGLRVTILCDGLPNHLLILLDN